MAPRKTVTKAATEKTTESTAAKPRTRTAPPKPSAKIIRNLRNCPVHLRLFGPLSEKPYRVELKPRGETGDISSIPVNVQDTPQFITGVGVLFEIITETEARQSMYQTQVGYSQVREHAQIISDSSSTIMTQPDVQQDATKERLDLLRRTDGAGPAYADVPGSDGALHETLREGSRNAALPDGAFPQRVTVERVKGA